MGASTNYGLPWPELTGSADGPAAFKALAEATDTQLSAVNTKFTMHYCRLGSNATQNIPNITFTNVTLQSARVGMSGMANTANSRINILRTGVYYIRGRLGYAYNTSGYRRVEVLNSSQVIATAMDDPPTANGVTGMVSADVITVLNAGDYIYFRAFQSSGGTLGILPDANYGTDLMVYQIV